MTFDRALVSVGGWDFPEPSTYKGTSSTLVDSGRNAQGYVIGNVIRPDVAKIEISYRFITVDDWSNILKCFNENYGGNYFREVTFFNETIGDWETRTMYISDRTGDIFRRDPQTKEVLGYKGVSFSLVEV